MFEPKEDTPLRGGCLLWLFFGPRPCPLAPSKISYPLLCTNELAVDRGQNSSLIGNARFLAKQLTNFDGELLRRLTNHVTVAESAKREHKSSILLCDAKSMVLSGYHFSLRKICDLWFARSEVVDRLMSDRWAASVARPINAEDRKAGRVVKSAESPIGRVART